MSIQSSEKQLLEQVRRSLNNLPQPLYVGLSGGMDSMLLLEALVRLQIKPVVLHINHGLQAVAKEWQVFCQQQATDRGLDFAVEQVSVTTGTNIEAAARTARYQAFSKKVGTGSLLLAQHRDDQAETFLLRLMRAAGVNGLQGMASKRKHGRMTLVRPLLPVPRTELARLADYWQLEWVEDPSNKNFHFDRNWLRHELLPIWQKRHPAIKQQLARSAEYMQDAAVLLGDLAAQDLAQLADGNEGLPIAALLQLPAVRRANLLRYWLADSDSYMPGRELLASLETEILLAQADARPRLSWQNRFVSRYQSRLYQLPDNVFSERPEGRHWLFEQSLDVGPLRLSSRIQTASQTDDKRVICLPEELSGVTIDFAKGGERLLFGGNHQRVAECWRAAGTPPWLRRWLPLFRVDGEIVAVAGIGTADNWRSGKTAARLVSWQLPPAFWRGCKWCHYEVSAKHQTKNG